MTLHTILTSVGAVGAFAGIAGIVASTWSVFKSTSRRLQALHASASSLAPANSDLAEPSLPDPLAEFKDNLCRVGEATAKLAQLLADHSIVPNPVAMREIETLKARLSENAWDAVRIPWNAEAHILATTLEGILQARYQDVYSLRAHAEPTLKRCEVLMAQIANEAARTSLNALNSRPSSTPGDMIPMPSLPVVGMYDIQGTYAPNSHNNAICPCPEETLPWDEISSIPSQSNPSPLPKPETDAILERVATIRFQINDALVAIQNGDQHLISTLQTIQNRYLTDTVAAYKRAKVEEPETASKMADEQLNLIEQTIKDVRSDVAHANLAALEANGIFLKERLRRPS